VSGELRQIRVPDGTRLAYRRFGPPSEGDEPRIVLCDGISCDGYIWRDLLPVLERRAEILHLNYRGHGRSGLPRDPSLCTLADLAGDVDHVLGQLGWSDAVLIGHSMGVQVALETAFRYPGRARALILCCGSYGRVLDTFRHTDLGARILPVLDAVTQTWREAVAAAVRALMPSPLAYALAALTEIKAARIKQKDLQPYLDHFARMPMDLFMGLLSDAAERTALPVVPRIAQKTLVLAGQDDGFTPLSTSRLLASRLPDAELVVVPGTSHTAPLEAPEAFEAAVTRFLDALPASPRHAAIPYAWPRASWDAGAERGAAARDRTERASP
jgi:pimeloyl-ACP methyl ester carboxylesterase